MKSTQNYDFSKAIDAVWRSANKADAANSVLTEAHRRDLLALVSLEYVIEHNVSGVEIEIVSDNEVKVHFSSPFDGAATIKTSHDQMNRLWRSGVARIGDIYLHSPVDKGSSRELDLLNLLLLAQVSRDHSDSLVFLPADLRETRIREYAKMFARDAEEIRTALVRLDPILRFQVDQ